MTVKECYEKMGGNYDEVFGRLRTEERIKKFLLMMVADKNYELLCNSIASGNIADAFRASHTLKGMCANLSVSKLFESASALTETLRGKTELAPEVNDLLAKVTADYELTVECIKALD